jgi:hypothetical protein
MIVGLSASINSIALNRTGADPDTCLSHVYAYQPAPLLAFDCAHASAGPRDRGTWPIAEKLNSLPARDPSVGRQTV